MRIYLAASTYQGDMEIFDGSDYPYLLLSFAHDWRDLLKYVKRPIPRLILDSGAFSAWNSGCEVKKEDYLAFIRRMRHSFPNCDMEYVNLDVIPGKPGTPGTPAEIERACSDSMDNANFFAKWQVPVMEVFHQDEDFSQLLILLKRASVFGTRMCISPRNDLSVKKRAHWLSEVYSIILTHWQQGAPRSIPFPRCHGLGVTAREMMEAFPFHSCDSSSWCKPRRFGEFVNAKGRQQETSKVIERRSKPGNALLTMESIKNYDKLAREITGYWRLRGIEFA